MYLLKLKEAEKQAATEVFTFHYVSIKTKRKASYRSHMVLFTFHYVSIKTILPTSYKLSKAYLHSTMYLLKLSS